MKNKICLIAGSNCETALAIAKRFQEEHHLILCWHKNSDRIQDLLKQKEVDSFCGDLSNEEQCRKIMEECRNRFTHIDVIINCIGKNNKENNITEEIWDDVMSNNLKPAYFLSKYYWKFFYEDKISEGQGCMIHIASTAGINPAPSSPHYVAAKAGVIALAKYFAKTMTPYVRVNVIAPCYIETSNHKGAKYDNIRNSNPLKRFVTTEEVAQTAAYITECTYLNAQTIVLDGGTIN